jgi:Flp pilus assembly protein TadD
MSRARSRRSAGPCRSTRAPPARTTTPASPSSGWDERPTRSRRATAVDLTVDDVDARYNAARLFERFGRHVEAEALYRDALRIRPDDLSARRRLAWLLATSPIVTAHRDEALSLAQALAGEQRVDPDVLDALAAAHAATDAFPKAIAAAHRAIRILIDRGERPRAEAIERRLALYRARQPYLASVPSSR